MRDTSNNQIFNNDFIESTLVISGKKNNVYSNTFLGSKGIITNHEENYISQSNILNGIGIRYYYDANCPNIIENQRLTSLILVECDNTIVRNNKITNGTGLSIISSKNILVDSNVFRDGCIDAASSSVISNNNISNCKVGIDLDFVSGTLVEGNRIYDNLKGIYLYSLISRDNEISENIFCPPNNQDIYDSDSTPDPSINSGRDNKCEKPVNWDDDGTSGCTFSCNEQIDMNLEKGWNLISSPLDFDGTESDFKQAVGYDNIITYDNSWSIPSMIDERYGMWVYMSDYNIAQVSGIVFRNLSYQIDEGWNLINYPFLVSKNTEEVFFEVRNDINMIYAYDGLWKSYSYKKIDNTLQDLTPGMGVWINANKYSNWYFDGDRLVKR
jgi:parallel beta-helix repeat protein